MKKPLLLICCLILLFITGCETRESVECIAPANAGGGWDLTCRALGNVVADAQLIEERIRVLNMPGAGGGVAYAHVVTERGEGEQVLVAASTGTTIRLAQGLYGEFSTDDVHWLGAIGVDYGMIAVAVDSPFKTLEDVVEAWRTDPGSATMGGGSAVGGQDHMMSLLIAKEAGIDPAQLRYVPFDGGGEALAAALGGHIALVSGDASSNQAQIEAGTMRALAVLSEKRLDGVLSHIPTAKELGYDVEWPIWRGYYAPKGTSDETLQKWYKVLEQTEQSEAWADVREQYGLQPYALIGEPFEAFIQQQVEELSVLSEEMALSSGG